MSVKIIPTNANSYLVNDKEVYLDADSCWIEKTPLTPIEKDNWEKYKATQIDGDILNFKETNKDCGFLVETSKTSFKCSVLNLRKFESEFTAFKTNYSVTYRDGSKKNVEFTKN